jgi:hypothetical protein
MIPGGLSERIFIVISSYKPHSVLFVLDSRMSKSGELAGHIRKEVMRHGISKDVRTSRSADHEIKRLKPSNPYMSDSE